MTPRVSSASLKEKGKGNRYKKVARTDDPTSSNPNVFFNCIMIIKRIQICVMVATM